MESLSIKLRKLIMVIIFINFKESIILVRTTGSRPLFLSNTYT